MPRRMVEFHDVILRLKIRNAGQRNVEYKAEIFIPRYELDRIRELILATGLDDVNLLDVRERPKPRHQQNPKAL